MLDHAKDIVFNCRVDKTVASCRNKSVQILDTIFCSAASIIPNAYDSIKAVKLNFLVNNSKLLIFGTSKVSVQKFQV